MVRRTRSRYSEADFKCPWLLNGDSRFGRTRTASRRGTRLLGRGNRREVWLEPASAGSHTPFLGFVLCVKSVPGSASQFTSTVVSLPTRKLPKTWTRFSTYGGRPTADSCGRSSSWLPKEIGFGGNTALTFWVNLPGANDFSDFFQYLGVKTARYKGLDAMHRKGILRIR